MKLPDPAAAPARLANRVLAEQDWAREKLLPFAGRVFTLAVGPLHAAWRVNETGTFDPAPLAAAPDLTLKLSPWALPPFLANPARWNEFVREEGDPQLGGALKDLAHTIPWFVEQMFARALGPLAGQRVADAGRSLLAFPEQAVVRITDSVASYARDEANLLARADAVRRFGDDVRAIADRVDALAVRVDALAPPMHVVR